MSLFQPAVRHQVKARIAIFGPSGSGKTWTALAVAQGLGDKIAVVDTENDSALHYAEDFTFHHLPMRKPYDPEKAVTAIDAATTEGFDVVIVDSGSHFWAAEGGTLDVADKGKAQFGGHKLGGWVVARPKQRSFEDAIVQAPIHVIVCMRSKTEWNLEEKKPRKVGMAPVQAADIEYEFSLALLLDMDHNATVEKSRVAPFEVGAVIPLPDAEVGRVYAEWAAGGEAAPVEAPHVGVASRNPVDEVALKHHTFTELATWIPDEEERKRLLRDVWAQSPPTTMSEADELVASIAERVSGVASKAQQPASVSATPEQSDEREEDVSDVSDATSGGEAEDSGGGEAAVQQRAGGEDSPPPDDYDDKAFRADVLRLCGDPDEAGQWIEEYAAVMEWGRWSAGRRREAVEAFREGWRPDGVRS